MDSRRSVCKIQLPAILGSSTVGEVVEVFNEADKHWIGKGVTPNEHKLVHKMVPARYYEILGCQFKEILAQYIVVNTDRLHQKPTYLLLSKQLHCL